MLYPLPPPPQCHTSSVIPSLGWGARAMGLFRNGVVPEALIGFAPTQFTFAANVYLDASISATTDSNVRNLGVSYVCRFEIL